MINTDRLIEENLRLRRLEGLPADRDLAPCDLSPIEADLYTLLRVRPWASYETIIAYIWGARPDCDQPEDPRHNLRVLKSRMNAKLRQIHERVETIPFQGMKLKPRRKRRARP